LQLLANAACTAVPAAGMGWHNAAARKSVATALQAGGVVGKALARCARARRRAAPARKKHAAAAAHALPHAALLLHAHEFGPPAGCGADGRWLGCSDEHSLWDIGATF
jgi:hypothetical protein